MEREQGFQFLGFFGGDEESFHVISASRKILSKIAAALVLPLSVIFLVHILFAELIFSSIYEINHSYHNYFPSVSKQYNNGVLVTVTSTELALFWLFRFAYVFFALVFSLFATSAVVYAVACFPAKIELTFRKVMKTVLRVWIRLIVTFLWFLLFFFVLNLVFSPIAFFFEWINSLGQRGIEIAAFLVLSLLYLIAFVYLTLVWQLANGVSVLETVYGLKSMVKSKNLMKGKISVSVAIFITLPEFFLVFQILFELLIAPTNSRNLGVTVSFALECTLLVNAATLLELIL